MKFTTFEEIRDKYPINNVDNIYFQVRENYVYCLTPYDIKVAKNEFKNGIYIESESKYYYSICEKQIWYTHYIYDGKYWMLGKDSWDGIYPVDVEMEKKERRKSWFLPNHINNIIATFKTEKEAINFINKRYIEGHYEIREQLEEENDN